MDYESILGGMIVLTVFIVFPLAGLIFSALLSNRAIKKRDATLHQKLGDDISIYRGFPIPQNHEEVAQGALAQIFNNYRELIVHDNWLFIQLSSHKNTALTIAEEKGIALMSIFAVKLDYFTPHIIIHNKQNRSIAARILQDKLTNKELIWCEAGFDVDHDIYNQANMQLDTLSILSPEVLEALKNPPGNADMILKRNYLYYIIPGNQPAEKITPDLLQHSRKALAELNNNLKRWAASAANKAKIEEIKTTELAVTQIEQYKRNHL